MYSFYEVSILKITVDDVEEWAVIMLEGGHSKIFWMMNTQEEALEEKEIRLSEASDRMMRYGAGRIQIETSESSPISSISNIVKYIQENDINWSPDLSRTNFDNWSITRLTRIDLVEVL